MKRCIAVLLSLFSLAGWAQDWPTQKAVHIVVGFAPGSTTDPFTDFIPVILGPSTPNIITVNPAIAVKNLQALVEFARKNRLSYASSGIGTTTHLSVERTKMAANVDIAHIPYQPAQAVGAAVAGHTQISSTSVQKWAKAVRDSGAKAD